MKCYDMLKTDYVLVNTIIEMADRQGSHGGAMVISGGEMMKSKVDFMENIVESDYNSVTMRARRPLKPKTYSFEKMMNKQVK